MERTLRKTELEKQKIEAMFKDINVKIVRNCLAKQLRAKSKFLF